MTEKLEAIAAEMVPQRAESICDVTLVVSEGGILTVKGETNLPEAKSAVIEMLEESGVTFADSITLLPDPVVVEKPWALTSVSVCNIRTRPSHAAEMATQALMGTPVRILNKRDGWLLVQTPDSYIGWTDDPLAELSDEELAAWKGSERLIYIGHTGVITDSRGETISDIVFGVILVKTGSRGNYWTVALPDGRTGEVRKQESEDFRKWAESAGIEPERLIRFARTFTGSPYLWGGTSTKGVDCSGLTKTVYYYGGVIMTRDASGQFRYGEEVSIDKPCETLLPGDLLFFGRLRDGKPRITHTGMYIGDTEYIHSSGLVKVNSFDSTRSNYSAYLLEILQGARRVTGFTPGKGLERVAQHGWYF
ncbi:MAG TPA: C40 family peptidase [Bacteroidales bacterium]|nr:C40 family peptidase [Bacteroidales bacterium]HNV65690.1 C40 family peptidase [Bacteroidales bacterium]HNY58489.1 C40 family peptidase [Bacteroidales bacterium]HOC04023.1 C40 family peptidase [Bacteroidales bacterium]HPH74301.1 C40 family peptidase [Bacteroidales bacterium]